MSKLILFDFRCTKCEHVFEELVKPGEYWTQCPRCGSNAQRQMSTPRIDRTRIALTNNASPESIAHFERIHKQRTEKENRTFKEHGDYGKPAGGD